MVPSLPDHEPARREVHSQGRHRQARPNRDRASHDSLASQSLQ